MSQSVGETADHQLQNALTSTANETIANFPPSEDWFDVSINQALPTTTDDHEAGDGHRFPSGTAFFQELLWAMHKILDGVRMPAVSGAFLQLRKEG